MRTLLFTSSLSVLLAIAGCAKKDSQPAPQGPEGDAVEQTVSDAPVEPEVAPTDAPETTTGESAGTHQNLKVLPNTWSDAEVKAFMKTTSTALGVQCDFCHNMDSMAEDTEMKTKARAMIEMTQGLDKEFFGGSSRLACMTCHNGKTEPGE